MAYRFIEIKSDNVFPPIPDRNSDWCSYYDGREEDSQFYGWGKTKEASINDMLNRDPPDDIALVVTSQGLHAIEFDSHEMRDDFLSMLKSQRPN